MDFISDDVIDERFKVVEVFNDEGGMGVVLKIEDLEEEFSQEIVLKYCRQEDKECRKRFKREVRLLDTFKGNSKIIQVLHYNVDYDPPYFVMDLYPDGDLMSLADEMEEDLDFQELVLDNMLSCISEMHSKDIYHRDIKPQNFLVDGEDIVVSDFGLGFDPNSSTRFTSSSKYWGTRGYLPPEFQAGGFKSADASGDIFMLGKTIYALLTGQDPIYMDDTKLPAPLFHVVEKCCAINKNSRYQSISELKQALTQVYEVLKGKGGPLGKVHQLLSMVSDKLDDGKYKASEVIDLIQSLSLMDENDQIKICFDLDRKFFTLMTYEKINSHLGEFLGTYQKFVESDLYSWATAETIADNMERIFDAKNVSLRDRKKALELAIDAAYRMNRFAAMDTCIAMIVSVEEDDLGMQVASVIQGNQYNFIQGIEPSECKCTIVRNAVISINEDDQ